MHAMGGRDTSGLLLDHYRAVASVGRIHSKSGQHVRTSSSTEEMFVLSCRARNKNCLLGMDNIGMDVNYVPNVRHDTKRADP